MVFLTFLYDIPPQTQTLLMTQLTQISKDTQTPFRVQISTNDIDEAIFEIQEERNISLIILGVEEGRKDKSRLALRLGKLAMRQRG